MLHWDKETFSHCDLKERGLGPYAEHPSTEVLLACYAFDDEPVQTWRKGESFPERVREYLANGGKIVAHNAGFEWALWNFVAVPKYGFPPIAFERFLCTQAMAYALAIPASLEKAALALGLEKQKDMAGSRHMMKMCKPKPDGTRYESKEDLDRLQAYCEQDVETERELYKRLVPLIPSEQELFYLDHKINWRGIKVDLPSIEKGLEIVERESARLDGEINKITGGVVATCSQSVALARWTRDQGVECDGVAKGDVTELLAREGLSEQVKLALNCRKEAAKSSTAKLAAMRERASKDSRVRGTMQYHGAGTGRWAGRGIQIHNFKKSNSDSGQMEETFLNINRGVGTLDEISNALRGFIIAEPGHRLIAVDFSSVESRILAWLSGEAEKLEVFRAHKDPYIYLASQIFHVPYAKISTNQRQRGKVAELACGYQGGVGALQVMAKSAGVKLTDEEAEKIKVAWRSAHPNTVSFWYDLERAAMAAVRNPGAVFNVRGPIAGGPVIAYKKVGSFLFCKLPSGRKLSYPYPKVELIETPWGALKDGLTYMGEDSVTRKWERQKGYGGLLAENCTQAVGACLLREALKRCESKGYPIVFHVHDEAVAEVFDDRGSLAEMEKIVAELPAWATGLPLEAEGFEGKRYRK